MSRILTIQGYLENKARMCIGAINSTNAYNRDVLNMIQRTAGPLEIITSKLISIPVEIHDLNITTNNIMYFPKESEYRIYTTCKILTGNNTCRLTNCVVSIPKIVFDMDDCMDIESYYTEQNMRENVIILNEAKGILNEQLSRIDPIIEMLVGGGKNISEIGGRLNEHKAN